MNPRLAHPEAPLRPVVRQGATWVPARLLSEYLLFCALAATPKLAVNDTFDQTVKEINTLYITGGVHDLCKSNLLKEHSLDEENREH